MCVCSAQREIITIDLIMFNGNLIRKRTRKRGQEYVGDDDNEKGSELRTKVRPCPFHSAP